MSDGVIVNSQSEKLLLTEATR